MIFIRSVIIVQWAALFYSLVYFVAQKESKTVQTVFFLINAGGFQWQGQTEDTPAGIKVTRLTPHYQPRVPAHRCSHCQFCPELTWMERGDVANEHVFFRINTPRVSLIQKSSSINKYRLLMLAALWHYTVVCAFW